MLNLITFVFFSQRSKKVPLYWQIMQLLWANGERRPGTELLPTYRHHQGLLSPYRIPFFD